VAAESYQNFIGEGRRLKRLLLSRTCLSVPVEKLLSKRLEDAISHGNMISIIERATLSYMNHDTLFEGPFSFLMQKQCIFY